MLLGFEGGPLGVNAHGAYWYDTYLYPIEWLVAWIMYGIHKALGYIGLTGTLDGLAWVLSIVGLTIIVRVAIIPLFFRQIKAQRSMQLLQPEIKKLQEKYKGRKDTESRMAMSAEMQALYKKHGANPMSSCWPVLLQMPIFFSLFSVLRSMITLAAGKDWAGHTTLGPIDQAVGRSFEQAPFLGVRLSDTLLPWANSQVETKIMCIVLIVGMVVTQFLTMRQLTMKNMPKNATDDDNPMMRTQKTMMYIMPLFMGFTGVFVQVGVLIYWLTTNLWTTGQQAWTIARMPAVGSEAYDKLMAKHKKTYEAYRQEITPGYDEKIAEAQTAGEQEKVDKLKTELAKKLHDKKVSLGLEEKKSKEEIEEMVNPTQTKRVQPQRTSRAARKAKAALEREKEEPNNKAGLNAEELEARREARRAAARNKKRNKKNK